MNPDLEKGDFLMPARPGDLDVEKRRPADIYIPTGWNADPMALDFAITSPTRPDIIAEAAIKPLTAASCYSSFKRTYLDTASQCRRVGVDFLPLVAESTGAWTDEALAFFHHVCTIRSRWSHQPEAALFHELMQELSVVIRSTNDRGVLRRMGELAARLEHAEDDGSD